MPHFCNFVKKLHLHDPNAPSQKPGRCHGNRVLYSDNPISSVSNVTAYGGGSERSVYEAGTASPVSVTEDQQSSKDGFG